MERDLLPALTFGELFQKIKRSTENLYYISPAPPGGILLAVTLSPHIFFPALPEPGESGPELGWQWAGWPTLRRLN